MNQTPDMAGQFNQPEDSKGSHLRFSEIWKIIKYRRWLVILILFLASSGTFIGHFIYTPTYRAVARISIKTEKPKTVADVMGAATWSDNNTFAERIHNYQQYLNSSDFLLEMAQILKFQSTEGKLIFEAPQNLSILKLDFWMWSAQHLIGKPIKKNMDRYDPIAMPIESIVGFLRSVLKVRTNQSTSISIEINTLDPYTSLTIANAIAKKFVERTNSHDSRGLLEVKALLQEKLDNTKKSLKKAELAMIDYKRQHRVSITAKQSTLYSDRINDVEKKIENINIQMAENNRLLKYYRNVQQKQIQSAMDDSSQQDSTSGRGQISLFNQKLDALKKQRSLMLSQNYDKNHWRVKEVTDKINKVARALQFLYSKAPKTEDSSESNIDIQKKISRLLKENRILKTKLAPQKASKKELMTHLNQIPEAEQFQLMLQRKVDLEYQNFSVLRAKMNDIEIQLVSLDKKVLIDRLARTPSASKRRSLPLKLIFSSLVGLFFGSMIAILLENLDSSIRRKSDLEDLGVHFLGEIPDTSTSNQQKKNKVQSPAQLVTLNNPDSLDSVVFDFVRSRLESDRARNGRTSGSMTITSVRPSEGKSFICANLAVSMAQLGKRTLLLDADLRCPSVHSYFNINNDQGLTDLFESSVGLDEVMTKSVIPNLDVFTAGWGCKNPTVLVSSEKFRILMKFLRNEYDYVIVDTPPIGAVADASIVSNMTDGITLVSRYRQTTKNDIQDAQYKIQQTSTKRIFGIINFASTRENIVTYYPYIVPRGTTRSNFAAASKNDDIQRFEDQLRKKKIG